MHWSAMLALLILTTILPAHADDMNYVTGRLENRTILLLDRSGSCREVDGGDGRDTKTMATAALSAFEDAGLSHNYSISIHNKTVSASSSPLEVLLEKLKKDKLNDILAVLYPGCTEDTTIIAEVLNTHVVQIPLVTFSFLSVPTMSLILPNHVHMVPSEALLPLAMQSVVQQYEWKRIAILTQDTSVFTALTDRLFSMLVKSGVEVAHQLFLDHSKNIDMDPEDLFGEDVRIFVLNMYVNLTLEVVCNARHLKHSSSYVWITHGWYVNEWWKNGSRVCSGKELESYLDGAIGVTHYPTSNDAYQTSSENGVMPETDAVVYDAVWAVVIALNNSAGNTSRDQFREELHSLSFTGKSGPVGFQNGVRTAGPIRILQYRRDEEVGLRRQTVALVQFNSEQETVSNFSYLNGQDVWSVWPAGIPHDATPIKIQHYPFTALLVIVYLYIVAGLVFTAICLAFNVVYRKRKLIRLSSPNLNYLIIVGAVMMYLSSVGFFYPEGSSSTLITVKCNFRAFTSSLGYSFACGTINAKMWRVYYICTKLKPSMQENIPLRDWHLMLLVLVFVLVDSIIYLVVLSLDNARYSVIIIPNKQTPGFTRNGDGIKEVSVVSRCYSSSEFYWLGVLFGYKIIIQALGVFLAFKIRKVKIRGLNEYREVSAILYITSAILAAMIVVSFAFGDYIDVDGFIFAFGLCTATTVVLVFTFVSKMWGLWKDPEGKYVLKGFISQASTSEAASSNTGELTALQSRIKELERMVKQKNDSTNCTQETSTT